MDLVVEDLVIVEIKTVERFAPIHEAQLLSYLKLYNKHLGLLINFHVSVLKNGIKRVVNNF
jgi:GxxExxY protein